MLKYFLFFLENMFLHMQIISSGDSLHEMSQPIFWQKEKCHPLNLVKVNDYCYKSSVVFCAPVYIVISSFQAPSVEIYRIFFQFVNLKFFYMIIFMLVIEKLLKTFVSVFRVCDFIPKFLIFHLQPNKHTI